MPWPRPISRHFRRWSSVASNRRGNHVSGAASSRPSARITTSWSSVTVTSTAVASSLTAEVDIPCLQEAYAVFDHEGQQTVKFVGSKTVGLHKVNRLQPELGNFITMLNVDV